MPAQTSTAVSTVQLSINCYNGAPCPPELFKEMIRTILWKYNHSLNPKQRTTLLQWSKIKYVSAFFEEYIWEFPCDLEESDFIRLQYVFFLGNQITITNKGLLVMGQ